MAFIVFNMLEEPGHIIPSFKLARSLAARGHRVGYLETLDFEQTIREQGFEFFPLFAELYPRGYVARHQRLDRFARLREKHRKIDAEIALFEMGAIEARIRDLGPDVLLVDHAVNAVALAARAVSVPCAIVNIILPDGEEPGIPPLDSPLAFGRGLLSRLRVELAWKRHHALRAAKKRLLDPARRLGIPIDPRPDWADWVRKYAGRCGVTPEQIDFRTTFSVPSLLSFPELCLCPKDFDFPRSTRPHRVHVESIDVARHEDETPALDASLTGRRLVYCSVGTQGHRYPLVGKLFQALLSAARDLPGYEFVIATGGAASLGVIPENVHPIAKAPQIRLLRRASVAITHGGLGTVKECIYLGVPMIVFPQMYDQPGNAARVAHHGLGAVGSEKHLSPASLRDLILHVDTDPEIRRRMDRMQRRFHEVESSGIGVSRVEALMNSQKSRNGSAVTNHS